MHGLLGGQESLRDGIVEEGLASLLKVGDLHHIELHSCLLFMLQHRAAVAQFLVLHLDVLVRQEGVHLLADRRKIGLFQNRPAEFPRLLQNSRVFRIGFHIRQVHCPRIATLSSDRFPGRTEGDWT